MNRETLKKKITDIYSIKIDEAINSTALSGPEWFIEHMNKSFEEQKKYFIDTISTKLDKILNETDEFTAAKTILDSGSQQEAKDSQ